MNQANYRLQRFVELPQVDASAGIVVALNAMSAQLESEAKFHALRSVLGTTRADGPIPLGRSPMKLAVAADILKQVAEWIEKQRN